MLGVAVLALVLAQALLCPAAVANPAAREALDEKEPFDWFVLPNSETDSDRGIGGGVLGLFYWYKPGVLPYRDKVEAGLILTSKLYQTHYLIWERLGIQGGKLRVRAKLGFIATQEDNFCGFGNEVRCDTETAEMAAIDAGHSPDSEAFDDFVTRYYQLRAMRPYFEVGARWKPTSASSPNEVSAKLSGGYEVAGFIGDSGPYPGSLFAERYPDGQEGWLQVLELGALLDSRNDELQPSGGWLAGAYSRGGARIGGSGSLVFGGATLLGAHYLALPGGRVVIANRMVIDLITGDAPVRELGRVGGLWSTSAFGGGFGRGVRSARFIGKIKGVTQSELRWNMWQPSGRLLFLSNLFIDAGWIGGGWDDFGGDPARLLASYGAGLGMAFGRSFVGRLDVALSGVEGLAPFFYLKLGNPF